MPMGEAKRKKGHVRLRAVEDVLGKSHDGNRVMATGIDMSSGAGAYGGLATVTDLKGAGQRIFPNMPDGAEVASSTCPTCGYRIAFTEGDGQFVMRYPEGESPCRRKRKVDGRPEGLYCPDFHPAYLEDFNGLLSGMTRRNRLRRS